MWLLTEIDDRLHFLKWRMGLHSTPSRVLGRLQAPLCDLRLRLEFRQRDRKLAQWQLRNPSDVLPGPAGYRNWDAAE